MSANLNMTNITYLHIRSSSYINNNLYNFKLPLYLKSMPRQYFFTFISFDMALFMLPLIILS